jgi:hypothetical protein
VIASLQTRDAVAEQAHAAMVWAEHKTACSTCSLPARRRTAKCAAGSKLLGAVATANANLAAAREADGRPHPEQGMLWPC